MLARLSDDLEAECVALDALLSTLPTHERVRATPFLGWTVRDQIVHLNQTDELGLLAMRDACAFAERVKAVRALQAEGLQLIDQARRDVAHLDNEGVLLRWRGGWNEIVTVFRGADPKRRMPWFGPDMSLASFATARQMEVWAHGQDIYDMLGRARPANSRIRNICELGVRTFSWSFRNRGLAVPLAPRVELAAPDGATWAFNPEGEGIVHGSAHGFALIVTQRRHVDDTDMRASTVEGRAWLEIAQCFAGAPADGPQPGERGPAALALAPAG